MKYQRTLVVWLLAVLLPVPVLAQHPDRAPLPAPGWAPLLYVHIGGPAGVRTTFFQGSTVGKDYPAPVTVGLRSGYIYRIKLSNLVQFPGVNLYPTLEVRGTLQMSPKIRVADYPAPVVFSTDDIERVLAGAVVTKVILLENPDQALPVSAPPDQPLEIGVRPGVDPVEEARTRGRPVLIVRLGEREVSPEELALQSFPGTILLPGEKGLPPATRRPQVPCYRVPLYDPLLGPKHPEEECLHDGGDAGLQAGLDGDGELQGLEPADTVAVYTDAQGNRHLAVSNRVCLCVPRFIVLRGETVIHGYENVVGLADARGVEGHQDVVKVVPSLETKQNEQPVGFHGRTRPSGSIGIESPGGMERVELLKAVAVDIGPWTALGTTAIERLTGEQRARLARQMELARLLYQPYEGARGTEQVQVGPLVVGRVEGLDVLTNAQVIRDVTLSCNEAPVPPSKPMVLHKWADRQSAQVGDVVTFYLKYSNLGGRPITEVAVSDSLTGRLEYVPGSARADRDTVFTTQPNEAGSVILHWDVRGTLMPGQSGVVTFQVRVR